MPGDRPTHAVTIRPALVELPLWIAWRTTRVVRVLTSRLAAAWPEITTEQARLLMLITCVACGFYGAGLLVAQ